MELFLLALCGCFCLSFVENKALDLAIRHTWDSGPIYHTPTHMALSWNKGDKFLTLHVKSQYFFDPPPPDVVSGEPYPKLWNYEVAEVFFLAPNNKYLEVEVSPHGKYLLLLLNGRSHAIKQMLPMKYDAIISEAFSSWVGKAEIPLGYLPHNVSKLNAYAIHGTGEDRQYEALYPVPKGKFENPNFHRLEYFKEFDVTDVVKDTSEIGKYWDSIERIITGRRKATTKLLEQEDECC